MAITCIALHYNYVMRKNAHYKLLNIHYFENVINYNYITITITIDTGYSHDGRADKNSYPHHGHADKDSYPHDGRADNYSYPHDRHNQNTMLS